MLISRQSPLTGKLHEMDIPCSIGEMNAYTSGTILQEAFPKLNADQREFIKTGITAEEWDTFMGDEE